MALAITGGRVGPALDASVTRPHTAASSPQGREVPRSASGSPANSVLLASGALAPAASCAKPPSMDGDTAGWWRLWVLSPALADELLDNDKRDAPSRPLTPRADEDNGSPSDGRQLRPLTSSASSLVRRPPFVLSCGKVCCASRCPRAWCRSTGVWMPFSMCWPQLEMAMKACRCCMSIASRVACGSITCPPAAAAAARAAWFISGPKYSIRPVRSDGCTRTASPVHMPTLTRGPESSTVAPSRPPSSGRHHGVSSRAGGHKVSRRELCSRTPNSTAASAAWKAATKQPSSPSTS
mmetsp:Transcript_35231/g.90129  ORF Transcript_35231/g.90129 Transcript_35231/m.90129 type:complete len:295 (-) Transcript_35231:810-1694(-)